MSQPFEMSILEFNGQKQIDFANNTQDFVEVVFVSDDREIRLGDKFSPATRGYCYPPYHHKPIRAMANGGELPIGGGKLKAVIYAGHGKIQEDYLNVPSFIVFKMNEKKFQRQQKAAFHRISNTPIAVLEIPA